MNKNNALYSHVTPVSKMKHRHHSVEIGRDYSFAKTIKSVPLTAVEFSLAAFEYSIVFTGENETLMPAAIFGIRDGHNTYITQEGGVDAKYIPAFLRRYPFILSTNPQPNTFTMCIDQSFHGLNEDGRGQKLFDEDGKHSEFTHSILAFLQDYQSQVEKTRAFCQTIQALELLSPMEAVLSPQEGSSSPTKITGFLAVNREKLNQLSDADKLALIKTGEWELIHQHLWSLHNLSKVVSHTLQTKMQDAELEAQQAKLH